MQLTIRQMKIQDLEPLYELLSDNEVMRYIEPVFSREKTEEFLKKAGLSSPPLVYAVDDNDGIFIGYVIYHDYQNDSKEIGWILKRDVWGKGYAQELTEQLIGKARADGKNVVIECSPEQKITKKIAVRNGFRFCGQIDGCDVFQLTQI